MEKSPVSTYILIGINVLAYGWLALQQESLMMSSPLDGLAILHTGGNFNPFTLGGEPWRIITSMFLHFGIIHLMVNMYGLYALGTSLEPGVGTTRFLLVYFFCGIAAGIASLLFNVFENSAGASGAIFGLFGYQLTATVIGNLNDRQALKSVFINFAVFVVINGLIATSVRVDMSGHIGGFVGGIVLGIFHFRLRWFIREKFLALLPVFLAATLFILPKGQVRYYELFQRVVKTENRTNDFFNTTNSDAELKDSLATLLPIWDSISLSLNSLPKIPASVVADTAILREYIQLRKQETFYKVMLVERQSFVYYDSIEIVTDKFDSLPSLRYHLNYNIEDVKLASKDTVRSDESSLAPVKVYYDSNWRETDDILSSKFFRIGKKDSMGRWEGAVLDYYKNGEIQMKGKYLKDMKNGVFLYYSDRRTYESAGRYDKEQAVGKWETFHWNGKLRSEVFYGDETFTVSVFDSLGNQQVVNGNGKAMHWYSSGQLAEAGEYKNGKKVGLWYGYHQNGRPYYKEEYRDNRLIHGVSEDVEGRRYIYDYLSEFPFPLKGMPAFKKYVEENKRLPFLRSSQGKVKLVFSVADDGSTWNYVVIQSVSTECDNEAIRLVKEGPPWRMALLHGQEKVPSQGYVEIEF